MKYTTNLKLKKPEGTDVVNIDDLNDNVDILDSELAKKVDKVSGKGLSTNDYTTAEKNKLAGIETGANKYVHPNIHPATMITTSDGKNVETKLTEVFQSGLDGKNLLETSIKSKGGTVSKQSTVATFNELDLGIRSIETDKTGDATAVSGDILSGKTAYAKGKKLVGSMPNRGSLAQTITTQGGQYNLPSGYYNGGHVKAQFANLLVENIKKGVNIGGVVGNYEGEHEVILYAINFSRNANFYSSGTKEFSLGITLPSKFIGYIFLGYIYPSFNRNGEANCYLKVGETSFASSFERREEDWDGDTTYLRRYDTVSNFSIIKDRKEYYATTKDNSEADPNNRKTYYTFDREASDISKDYYDGGNLYMELKCGYRNGGEYTGRISGNLFIIV